MSVSKQIIIWVSANAILPMLLPVLCVWVVPLFIPVNQTLPTNLWEIFKTFLSGGYYIFSALTLFCSLLEDYKIWDNCINGFKGILLGIITILTFVMFLLDYADKTYIDNHLPQFVTIWVLMAISAISVKIQLIEYKKRNKLY